ncbi:EAL domain-containing protein [Paenibacillus polygoni]|uniref:EAL domain-containing protein n=1 Tax=Paenibacillus polygoni TaxID=3050112 RepID=A0ABY8X5K9_9BACL|nr:bifunctional diguanylate cyclase/phosphodiesterase [Paenibacillus polygoni]WIV20343.1 EAL domain-containing protein [Paenibacillus polygoni]
MYNMILQIICLFIPFLILFAMGIEVYFKNPRSTINRLSMLLLFSLSLFFLGGFWAKTLPIETGLYVTMYVKYISIFVTMTLGLYLYSLVSKVRIKPIFRHLLCLVPSIGIFPILMNAPETSVSSTQSILGRSEQLDSYLLVMIMVISGYNFLMLFLFSWIGNRQRRSKNWSRKERLRQHRIKQGLVFSLIWAVFWSVISLLKDSFGTEILFRILPYEIMPAYCILIWAYFIRSAMVHYDFLASPNRRFEVLFSLSRQGIALVNQSGFAVEMNEAFRRSIGIPNAISEEGIDLNALIPEEDRQMMKELYKDRFDTMTPIHIEQRINTFLHETKIVEIDSAYLEIDDQIFCYLVTRDITETKNAEAKLQKLAYEDNLTGLGNRLHFMENLEQALQNSDLEDRQTAVIMIDLDQFKWINDTLGHSAGDFLLQHVAHQIRNSMPSSAVISRLGGDEFAITVPVNHSGQAICYANQLLSSLQQPIHIFGKPYTVTASVGISIAPEDGRTIEALYSSSDTAMYAAKQAGRNQYYAYTPNLKAMAERNLTIVNGLSTALANDEFTLYYQPQIDTHTNRILGLEALIRWKSPELGFVSPAQFIPIAEDTGMIKLIGDWVLNAAFKQTKQLVDEGYVDILVSVNLSAHQLREPLFAKRVAELLQQYKLTPRNICLEITESTAIFDLKKSLEICRALVELGISLSIDDFGTGFSSLSMLNRFPFKYIKIDRSLIQDIAMNINEAKVVQTIIELADRLGMRVIAEGVETEQQLSLLRNLGCHEVQGYLTGRPMPREQLMVFLEDYKK